MYQKFIRVDDVPMESSKTSEPSLGTNIESRESNIHVEASKRWVKQLALKHVKRKQVDVKGKPEMKIVEQKEIDSDLEEIFKEIDEAANTSKQNEKINEDGE